MNAPAPATLPAEARLVFLTACGEWADDHIANAMTQRLDWASVHVLATREHASAAAAHRLGRLGVPTDAEATLDALRRQGTVEEFRMALLEERLEALMSRLHEAGVDFVLLKGSALALRYFGNLKARPMGDVDVLVEPVRAADAQRVARELGWVSRPGLRDEMYVGMPHLPPFVAGDGLGFGLEIHTALFPDDAPFHFPPERIWRDAVRLPRPGGPAVPAPEHLLLHACIHFAWSHGFRRGAWRTVRDLDALVSDPALRKPELASLVKDARAETCVYWTCALVGELTGRPLSLALTEGPQTTTGALHDWVLRHLVLQAVHAPDTPGTRRLARMLWTLAVRPRASGHGSARPWKGDERWLDLSDRESAVAGGWGERLTGFVGYARRVVGWDEPGARPPRP